MYLSQSLTASTRYITLFTKPITAGGAFPNFVPKTTAVFSMAYSTASPKNYPPLCWKAFGPQEKYYPAYSGFVQSLSTGCWRTSVSCYDIIFFQNALKSKFCILPKHGTSRSTNTISWANHAIEVLA